MTIDVSDIRSNAPEQIQSAANMLGKSKQNINVFEAIYKGKKKIKTVEYLKEFALQDIKKIKYREIRILNIVNNLHTHGLVTRVNSKNGRFAYEKINFFSANYKKIIKLARNHKKNIITRRTPQIKEIKLKTVVYKNYINIKQVTVDDLDNFCLAKKIKKQSNIARNVLEIKIKKGFQKIIGEKGKFTDWGGEKNDLFTTRLKLNGKRITVAIAFKGRATQGILTPRKLGKHGDQINRLFTSSAQVFLIVYHSEISETVIEQMKAFAIASSYSGQKIYYGIIDGIDLNRIINAYKKYF